MGKIMRYKIDFITDSPDCPAETFVKWCRNLMSNLDNWDVKEIDDYVALMIYHNSKRLKPVAKTLLTLVRASKTLKRWGFGGAAQRDLYKLVLSYIIPSVWEDLTGEAALNHDNIKKIKQLIEDFINLDDVPDWAAPYSIWDYIEDVKKPIIDIINEWNAGKKKEWRY